MRLSREWLNREATTTGFRVEILEKVTLLLNLLDGFDRHPYLKGRLALKGGTALNLFVFDAPRLSIDIDLNYVGRLDREAMLAERPDVERALGAVCGRAGISIDRAPGAHAGGKWRLRYESAEGRSANLELDVNYMLRAPLWDPAHANAKSIGGLPTPTFPILDIHAPVFPARFSDSSLDARAPTLPFVDAATTVISTRVPGARSACTQARCGQFAGSPIHSHHSASICALFAMSVR